MVGGWHKVSLAYPGVRGEVWHKASVVCLWRCLLAVGGGGIGGFVVCSLWTLAATSSRGLLIVVTVGMLYTRSFFFS